MDFTGKPQLIVIIESPPEWEAEGDRIFERHIKWMERTHYREGDNALLQCNIAKSRLDNGNIVFVMSEVYESQAGIADHIAQGKRDGYNDTLLKWWENCQVTFVGNATVVHSLWK